MRLMIPFITILSGAQAAQGERACGWTASVARDGDRISEKASEEPAIAWSQGQEQPFDEG
jgi:hypothetical protein